MVDVKVDVEALQLADELIAEHELVSNKQPHPTILPDLRIALAARIKVFCADRMRKKLMDWMDDEIPEEKEQEAQ